MAIQMTFSIVNILFFMNVVCGQPHNENNIGTTDSLLPIMERVPTEKPSVPTDYLSTEESANTFLDGNQPDIPVGVDHDLKELVSAENKDVSISSGIEETRLPNYERNKLPDKEETKMKDNEDTNTPDNEETKVPDSEVTESFVTQSSSPDMGSVAVTEEDLDIDLRKHVINLRGLKYLDISKITISEIELGEMEGVHGITAENGNNCKLNTLVVLKNYHIDKTIVNCKSLENITLLGKDWICVRDDWTWLKELKDKGKLFCSEALCVNVKIYNTTSRGRTKLQFDKGSQFLQNFDIEDCPQICRYCITLVTPEGVFHSHRVYCGDSSITDQTIPIIPTKTTHLYLDYNKLKSTSNLFRVLENLNDITEIVLSWNSLDSLPFLEENTFTRLERIELKDNNIRKMDAEALESIVIRKKIEVTLQDNPFNCDCNVHFSLKICLENISKFHQFIEQPLRCINETSNVAQIISLRPDECELPIREPINIMIPILFVLALLNIIFIYLNYDLIKTIKECRATGGNKRDPTLHVIVTGIARFLKFLFRRKKVPQSGGLGGGGGGGMSGEQDVPVTLRGKLTSSLDRESFIRRNDRRRLTPCPT